MADPRSQSALFSEQLLGTARLADGKVLAW
jgi:hypothetical protein